MGSVGDLHIFYPEKRRVHKILDRYREGGWSPVYGCNYFFIHDQTLLELHCTISCA